MNCPSRTEELPPYDGLNQNPPDLAADLTTRQDLNGLINRRDDADYRALPKDPRHEGQRDPSDTDRKLSEEIQSSSSNLRNRSLKRSPSKAESLERCDKTSVLNSIPSNNSGHQGRIVTRLQYVGRILRKFSKFIGPGFLIAVAYIDPGNYSTDVAAGASTEYKLLFVVLMSNVFAIVLQSLAVRLGTVTGLDLAQHCRAHLPPWLNIALYIFAEAAIVATDMAEVIGSAIALNLLIKVPLVAGCAITIVDVLIILLFYKPNGSMRRLRAFEYFVMILVLGVVVCFCVELSIIQSTSVGAVFKGYLPSVSVVRGQGLYLACGILGATVMPHSLYLGSGMVQPRLREFDIGAGNLSSPDARSSSDAKIVYKPSLAAIRACLYYSTAEVGIALATFALFVNSAILIVAASSLSSSDQDADLFGVHDLLSKSLAPIAGTIFALALLLSGTSAGIVCTIAGQMLSEGALNWTMAPWLRRLVTRSISITPSIIIAGAVGKEGLSAALNGTQVALSIILPFVSAPLVYFTCRNKYMVVGANEAVDGDGIEEETEQVRMRNHWLLSAIAIAVWLVIAIMNVTLLVFLGLGKT